MAIKLKLPKLPSELIAVALEDLEAVEKLKSVTVDMSTWITGSGNKNSGRLGVCKVCLAGAVLHRRGLPEQLNAALVDGDGNVNPSDHCDKDTSNKLLALDCFRQANVRRGLYYMGLEDEWDKEPRPFFLEEHDMLRYERDPVRFKRQLALLGKMLAAHGF